MSLKLLISSPEKKIFEGEINLITLPGVEGSFQILKNHAPMIAVLESGKVIIKTAVSLDPKIFTKEKEQYSLLIKSGTLEISNNYISLLIA